MPDSELVGKLVKQFKKNGGERLTMLLAQKKRLAQLEGEPQFPTSALIATSLREQHLLRCSETSCLKFVDVYAACES